MKSAILLIFFSAFLIKCNINPTENDANINAINSGTEADFKYRKKEAYYRDSLTGNFLEGYWIGDNYWLKWGSNSWSDSSKYKELFDDGSDGYKFVNYLWHNDNFISLLCSCGSPCHAEAIFPFQKELKRKTHNSTFKQKGQDIAMKQNLMVGWGWDSKNHTVLTIENLLTDEIDTIKFEEYDGKYTETGKISDEDWTRTGNPSMDIDTLIYENGEIAIIQYIGKYGERELKREKKISINANR